MENHQEDKLGMYEKVKAFLFTFAAALASVTQIAGLETTLNDNIDDIIDADIVATEDDTCFTEQKSSERSDLEELVLKVARALSSYWASIGSTGSLRLTDYRPSELEALRDNDMFAAAKRLFDVAEPLSASLSAFNSGPADVTDLGTKMDEYFSHIQLPKSKQGVRIAAGKDVDRLMEKTDNLLKTLDIYLSTFATIDENMYDQYKSARSIDDSGGGSSKVRRGNLDPDSIRNATFAAGQISEDTVLEFANTGISSLMVFYFASSPLAVSDGVTTEVAPGASIQKTALDAGYLITKNKLTVFNQSAQSGKWRVKIIPQP
ncbi:MAG: hypothetical protein IPP77_10385 [Bacteroidetes bacterium]|nr:hypothetical protein [Bacteroidota bacterium]